MKRLSAILLIFAAALAGAQSMKPGLWELNNKMKNSNPEMGLAMSAAAKQLASMPPEQRKQMEDMMAQHGAGMPKIGGDGGVVVTACITPEMAARHDLPTGQQGHCSSQNQPVADGLNVSFNCTSPASSGHGQVRFNGDTAFNMTMNVSSSARGKPEQMTVETSGHWLGPNCTGKSR